MKYKLLIYTVLMYVALCLGCNRTTGNRPLLYYQESLPLGTVGMNHVISHRDYLNYPAEVGLDKFRRLREAGCTWMRMGISWNWYGGEIDEKRIFWINAAYEHGIQTLCILHVDEPTNATPEEYAAFCKAVVLRLETVCSSWEIGNEPNNTGMDPDRYVEYLKAAYTAIKQVQPYSRVLMGAAGHTDPITWLRRTHYDPTVEQYYDILAVHPYDRGWSLVNEALKVTSKPLWITEDGTTASNKVPAVRGSFCEYLANPRIQAVFWFAMTDYDLPEFNLITAEGDPPVFTETPGWKEFSRMVNERHSGSQ